MSERRMAVRRQRLKERAGTPNLFREHLALVASAVLVLLSVIRVYYFAGLHPDVALTVLSVANRTQVLVSTLLNAIVAVAPWFLLFAPLRRWMLAGNQMNAPFLMKLRTAALWVPLGPIFLTSLSATLLAGYLVGGIIVWVAALVRKRKRRNSISTPAKEGRYVDDGAWYVATFVGTALMLALISPWQPLEKISVEGADKPVIGYVVGEQAGKTLILDELRNPLWTDSVKVEGREMCAKEESWLNSPLTTLVPMLLDRQRGVNCS